MHSVRYGACIMFTAQQICAVILRHNVVSSHQARSSISYIKRWVCKNMDNMHRRTVNQFERDLLIVGVPSIQL